jgi:hypothetical protein
VTKTLAELPVELADAVREARSRLAKTDTSQTDTVSIRDPFLAAQLMEFVRSDDYAQAIADLTKNDPELLC